METSVLKIGNKGKRTRDQIPPSLQNTNKKVNIKVIDLYEQNLTGHASSWAKTMFRTMNDNDREFSEKLTRISYVEIANLKTKDAPLEARITVLE